MNPLDSTISANTPYKILRLYLKGASVEVPHMANLPQQAMSPQVGVDMQTEATPAGPGALECVLRVSLHARLEGQNVFMIEVSEAGVFELDLTDLQEAHRFVRQVAPSVLFPFARKDLANLAVSAGFQPVLLDHVDFDTLLTQVIKSQRRTRVSAPMRVDVIAAKPPTPALAEPVAEVPPAPQEVPEEIEVELTPENPAAPWSDTLPSTFGPETEPMVMQTPVELVVHAKKSGGKRNAIIMALLGMTSLGAMLAWMTLHSNTVQVPPVAAVIAPKLAPPPAPVPPPAAAPVAILPPETQTALATSQARLSEQPSSWFTLDLGVVSADTPTTELTPKVTDRPLFVRTTKNGGVRVLYGVFPTKASAESARTQLQKSEGMKGHQAATVVTIGSL